MTSKYLYKVRLEEGYFEKGLDELIKLGSKNIDTHINKKINPEDKKKTKIIFSKRLILAKGSMFGLTKNLFLNQYKTKRINY